MDLRTRELLDPEHLKPDARADNVDDRIKGSDFVKMDLRKFDPVDSSLSFGKPTEDGERAVLNGLRKR